MILINLIDSSLFFLIAKVVELISPLLLFVPLDEMSPGWGVFHYL